MKELILIRHGESQYNVGLTDFLDSELTENGIKQVKATGKFLREHFGHLQNFVGLTSPYLRCLQTSRILREETGLEFRVTPAPREIMCKYDSVVIPARKEEFPEFVWNLPCPSQHWKEDAWHFFNESEEKFVDRIMEFVGTDKPASITPGKISKGGQNPPNDSFKRPSPPNSKYRLNDKTIIVSHGTPVSSMYEIALGINRRPDTDSYVRNASITYIRNNEGVWFGKIVYDSSVSPVAKKPE